MFFLRDGRREGLVAFCKSSLLRCYDTSGGGQVVGPPGVWKEGNELELSPGSCELVEIPNCLWTHFSQIPIGTRYNKDLKKDFEKTLKTQSKTFKNHDFPRKFWIILFSVFGQAGQDTGSLLPFCDECLHGLRQYLNWHQT